MREFSTGATRDDDETKPDYRGFFSPRVLKRRAQYMHEHRIQADGALRASDNWKKGIPQLEYLSSLLRHVVELWDLIESGVIDEKILQDLICAIGFNADGLLHERILGRDVGTTAYVWEAYPKGGKITTPSIMHGPSREQRQEWQRNDSNALSQYLQYHHNRAEQSAHQ